MPDDPDPPIFAVELSRAIAAWCDAMVPIARAFAAELSRALTNWERAARPLRVLRVGPGVVDLAFIAPQPTDPPC